ncbi:maleylacetate reductase [Lentzea sp. NPDC051838]|uniref:maleylacetate reductase n=1 Tax=Lentzea sp. NPDC051838 TaxID=3154849 RepID=UPI00344A00E9
MSWEHVTLGQRVRFGTGQAASHLADEVERLGAQRVMLIAEETAPDVASEIEVAVRWTDVAPHVPVEIAERARKQAEDVDLLVSVGGGSTTGLAKAIALTTGLPIIAVPTTYAGSEATNVWGLTEASRKTTGSDDRVLPTTVIYDAALTASLPDELAIASGCNALAHCVDSMWAPRADPINQALAVEGIRALRGGLRRIGSVEGREQTLYGAYLSAVAFASAGSGLHHKICHVLGGAYNLPHAQTHTAILPYVLAFNTPAAPEAGTRIAEALGGDLITLYGEIGASHVLHGVPDVVEAAKLIMPSAPPSNPRPVTEDDLTALLAAASAGQLEWSRA